MSILSTDNTVIRFIDSNNVVVEQTTEKGSEIRYIKFNDFVQAILSAHQQVRLDGVDAVDSPIFPQGMGISTVQYRELSTGAQVLVLEREPIPFDITYFDDMYKNVGMPKLLFGIKIFKNIIQSVRVMAVKDFIVKEDTPMFNYPFSNVQPTSGNVCFGLNRISNIDVKSLTALHSLPDMFLSIPNNNDNYGHNLSSLQYRPLLEALVDKDFNNDWLQPADITYKDWFGRLG